MARPFYKTSGFGCTVKPGFHIIVTIVWITVNDSSDPSDPSDLMETRTNDPSDPCDQDRWDRNLFYSSDPPAIATIEKYPVVLCIYPMVPRFYPMMLESSASRATFGVYKNGG